MNERTTIGIRKWGMGNGDGEQGGKGAKGVRGECVLELGERQPFHR